MGSTGLRYLPQVLLLSHPMHAEQTGMKAQVSDSPCSPPFPLPDPGAPPDLSHPKDPKWFPCFQAPLSRLSQSCQQMGTPKV